jgi:hypothetical protein
MRLVNFSKEIIRIDVLSFSLDGKIEPNFFNAGTSIAYIDGISIPPGSSFQAGTSNAITMGSVEITFAKQKANLVADSSDRPKHLICFFGKLISEDRLEDESSC